MERFYMTAHCVAPQQSFRTATLLFVMDGLFGGGSGVDFFTFGGPGKVQGWELFKRLKNVISSRSSVLFLLSNSCKFTWTISNSTSVCLLALYALLILHSTLSYILFLTPSTFERLTRRHSVKQTVNSFGQYAAWLYIDFTFIYHLSSSPSS